VKAKFRNCGPPALCGLQCYCPMWSREHCRISPPRFLAECSKRRLSRASFVFAVFCIVCFLGDIADKRFRVLRSHVVRLSFSPSVTLVGCDHIRWNSSRIIWPLVSMGVWSLQTSTSRISSKGSTPKFWPKVTHPLLIWALETFDRKLRPNG